MLVLRAWYHRFMSWWLITDAWEDRTAEACIHWNAYVRIIREGR